MTDLIDKAEALAILAPAPNSKDGLWAKRKNALYEQVAALPARDVGVPADVKDYAIEVSEAFDTMMEVERNPAGAWQAIQALAGHIATTPAVEAPAEDAHVKGETAGQMLERLGMDGVKWAAEFRTTALRLGYSDMDEGWLIGWFCNAIMAGYDRSAAQAREAAIRECASALRKVIDYAAFAGADPDEVDDEAINSYADYLLTLIDGEDRT